MSDTDTAADDTEHKWTYQDYIKAGKEGRLSDVLEAVDNAYVLSIRWEEICESIQLAITHFPGTVDELIADTFSRMLKTQAEQLTRLQIIIKRGMLAHDTAGGKKWYEVNAEMETELLPQLRQLEDRFIHMTETYAKVELKLMKVREHKQKRAPIDLADLRRRMALDDELIAREKTDVLQTG